jgi:hypothetical protein
MSQQGSVGVLKNLAVIKIKVLTSSVLVDFWQKL